MATIALNGTSINFGMGICAFDSLGTSFKSAKKTTGGLQKAIGNLINKIDLAKTAAKVETAQTEAKNAKTREETKESSLTLAYDKLDTLINDVGTVDNKVSTKVSAEKNDFYKKYEYLKPECEKSFKEKIKDGFKSFCDKVVEIVGGFVEWCKEHWKELLIGLVCIVIGAVLTALTGGAFLAAFVAGFKAALIAGLISGGINVAIYTVATLINGKKWNFAAAMSSFGDGLASGFMIGGIFAGASMIIGSGLRFAIAKSPQLASKLLSNGKMSEFLLKRMVPAGAKNTFVPSSRIAEGYKYDIQISRIFGQSTKFQLKWHSPDLMWATAAGSNSGAGWTAQIKLGNKFLTTLGTLVRNNRQNIVHIPIIRWPWW